MTILNQELKEKFRALVFKGASISMDEVWIWITNVYGKRVREEVLKKNTRRLINQFGEAIENFIGRDMARQIVSEVKSNLSPTQKKGKV